MNLILVHWLGDPEIISQGVTPGGKADEDANEAPWHSGASGEVLSRLGAAATASSLRVPASVQQALYHHHCGKCRHYLHHQNKYHHHHHQAAALGRLADLASHQAFGGLHSDSSTEE